MSETKRMGQSDGDGEKEKSVICERLVQLSAAELQEVAWVLASINNSLLGALRG